MSKAYEIFDEAFLKPRDPRSDEYRHGVIDILKFRLREANEASGAVTTRTVKWAKIRLSPSLIRRTSC